MKERLCWLPAIPSVIWSRNRWSTKRGPSVKSWRKGRRSLLIWSRSSKRSTPNSPSPWSRRKWINSSNARGRCRSSWMRRVHGILTPSLRWRWMPCGALRGTRPFPSSPVVKSAVWRCAAYCCRIPISFCSTNLPTTWTPNPWRGWNGTSRISPVRSLP